MDGDIDLVVEEIPATMSLRASQNGTLRRTSTHSEDTFTPPDGGTRAWLVMIGSFLCNGILFGVINSYSVFHSEIYEDLRNKNVSEANSKAALVGSLTMGTTFVISPVAGLLTDLIGIRTTTFLGGVLACAGMLLSSMFAYNVFALYFTYGIMYGLGCALAYTPSLVILGHYFKKYLGVVNGIVTAGSSIFTIILSYLIAWCLGSVGLVWALRVLALIACGIILCALLFKPVMQKRKKRVKVTDVFNVSIWRNTKYLVWALVIPISLFGYFVPYVHMSKFVNDDFGHNSDGKLPVICMGITSGLGRLFFGYIADLPKVNRILLQQISFLSIGILTILLPSTKGNFPLLIGLSLAMGFFDGCFISLLGPIAFDICGPSGATQAIGFLFGLCSLPMTLGPFVAGKLYDRSNNYDLAFRLAGIPPIVGALSMFLMKFVDEPEIEKESSRQPLRTLSKEDSGLHRSTTAPPLASAETLDEARVEEGPV